MKKKLKLFMSIASLCISLAVLCFGVYAATSVNYTASGSVSYTVKDVFVNIETRVYSSSLAVANETDLATLSNTLSTNVAEFPEATNFSPSGYSAELLDKDVADVYNHTYTTSTNPVNQTESAEVNLDLKFDTTSKYAFYVVIQVTNLSDIDVYVKANEVLTEIPDNTIYFQSASQKLDAKNTQDAKVTKNFVFAIALDDVTKSITGTDNFVCPIVIDLEEPEDKTPAIIIDELATINQVFDEQNQSIQNLETLNYQTSLSETTAKSDFVFNFDEEGNPTNAVAMFNFGQAQTQELSTYSTTQTIQFSFQVSIPGMTQDVTNDYSEGTILGVVDENFEEVEGVTTETVTSEGSVTAFRAIVPDTLDNFIVGIVFSAEIATELYALMVDPEVRLMGIEFNYIILSTKTYNLTTKSTATSAFEYKTFDSTLGYSTHNFSLNNVNNYQTMDFSFSIGFDGTAVIEGTTYYPSDLNWFSMGFDILYNPAELTEDEQIINSSVYLFKGSYTSAEDIMQKTGMGFDQLLASEYVLSYTPVFDQANLMISLTNIPATEEFTLFVLYNNEYRTQIPSVGITITKNEIKIKTENPDLNIMTKVLVSETYEGGNVNIGESLEQSVEFTSEPVMMGTSETTLSIVRLNLTLKDLPIDAKTLKITITSDTVFTEINVLARKLEMGENLYVMYPTVMSIMGGGNVSQTEMLSMAGAYICGMGSNNEVVINLNRVNGNGVCLALYSESLTKNQTISLNVTTELNANFEQFTYELNTDGNTYTVTGINIVSDTIENLVIPSSYMGKNVTNIGLSAFSGYDMKTVVIPDTITSVVDGYSNAITDNNAAGAFESCKKLETVTLSKNLKTLAARMFFSCSNLKNIDLTYITQIKTSALTSCGFVTLDLKGIKNIPDYFCNSCENLETIIGLENVTSIGDYSFQNCPRLSNLNLRSVVTIGNHSFYGCLGITELNMPNLETLGNSFGGCETIALISAPKLMSIASAAFGGNTKLFNTENNLKYLKTQEGDFTALMGTATYVAGTETYTMNNNCKIIADYAFNYNTDLKTITFGDNIEYIGSNAFENTNLKTITFGDNVKSVGTSAFLNCTGLTTVNVSSIDKWAQINFDDSNANPLTVSTNAKLYANGVEVSGEITITGNENFTKIGSFAFYGYQKITTVTIGDGITGIGSWAFYDNKSIILLTIGKDVSNIGYNAFYECYKLVEVINYSTNITVVKDTTNGYCGNYTKSITNVLDENVVESKIITIDGVYYYDDGEVLVAMGLADNTKTKIVLDARATEIVSCAFYNCSNLQSVTIPKNAIQNVPQIRHDSFLYCYKLIEVINYTELDLNSKKGTTDYGYIAYYAQFVTDVTDESVVESKITTIGGVDYYVDGEIKIALSLTDKTITNLVLDDDTDSINQYAFYDCTNLQSVTIPDSVTSIAEGAFQNCSNLKTLNLGNSVTSVGQNAFQNCVNLTAINVAKLEDWAQINFYDYNSNPLREPYHLYENDLLNAKLYVNGVEFTGGDIVLTGNETFTKVGNYAFYRNSKITSVTIGAGISTIGEWAFRDCEHITTLTLSNSVTSIGYFAFGGCYLLDEVNYEGSSTDDISMPQNQELLDATWNLNYTIPTQE